MRWAAMSDLSIPGRKPSRSGGSHRLARIFGRNTAASILAFGFDVALLWIGVEYLGLPPLPTAAVAFMIAMSLHYVLARIWVFPNAERGLASGYLYFLVNAGVGLVVTLAAFWALTEWTEIHYLIARVIASVAAGILVFGLNAVFNFKVAGPVSRRTDRARSSSASR